MTASHPTFTTFLGHRRLASGSLAVNALAVKKASTHGVNESALTFCDQTGALVDIDISGSEQEMLARLPHGGMALEAPAPSTESAGAAESAEPRGRGRPKLGVIAREVTLLPRHWEWLAAQPGGASVSLRKLVDEARKANVESDRQRQASERAYRFMAAMAGDMAGFEDASRALFANDAQRFHQLTDSWPADLRNYLRALTKQE
jgi:hypothetical protein